MVIQERMIMHHLLQDSVNGLLSVFGLRECAHVLAFVLEPRTCVVPTLNLVKPGVAWAPPLAACRNTNGAHGEFGSKGEVGTIRIRYNPQLHGFRAFVVRLVFFRCLTSICLQRGNHRGATVLRSERLLDYPNSAADSRLIRVIQQSPDSRLD
jgi:hypothetical protein